MSIASPNCPPARLRVDEEHLEELLRRLSVSPADGGERERLRQSAIHVALPLATRLARRYRNHGEPDDDLRQVAAAALVQAVDGYRPGYGPGFVAYAVPTILGALRRHFRDHTWSVRVPRPLQDLRLRITAAEQLLEQRLCRRPTAVDLAAELDVTVADVLEAQQAAQGYRAVSLQAPSVGELTVGDRIGAEDGAFAAVDDAIALRQCLAALPERLQRVVTLRFYGDLTQSEIAELVGVSQMHVSRLLRQALDILRAHLTAADPVVGSGECAEPRPRTDGRDGAATPQPRLGPGPDEPSPGNRYPSEHPAVPGTGPIRVATCRPVVPARSCSSARPVPPARRSRSLRAGRCGPPRTASRLGRWLIPGRRQDCRRGPPSRRSSRRSVAGRR